MKRLLLFTLTLCFCINIQAKESTVIYKLNGYKTLSITGNFEKGLLTDGPVQFNYKTAAHTVKLEGTYSPQNQTFQGWINGTLDSIYCLEQYTPLTANQYRKKQRPLNG